MENNFEKQNDNNTIKRKTLVSIIFNDILHERITTSNMKLFQKLLGQSGLNKEDLYNFVDRNKDYIIDNIGSNDCSFNTKIFAIFSLFRNTLGKVTYAGCYEIINKQTNEIYIGESIDLFRRFTKHTSDLYENKHHCTKLQEAFNITKTMDNFVIKPIKVNPIVCADKMKIKEETLYMESAYYLMYKNDGYTLYNTINPYEALKNDEVYVGDNKVNCKNVLCLLCEDKYNILDHKMLMNILNDLKGNPLIIVPRKRLEVKAGVATKVEITKDEKMINDCKKILSKFKIPGFCNVQFIKTKSGENYFIELNPRFGGFSISSSLSSINMVELFLKLGNIDNNYEENMSKVKWNSIVTRYYEEVVYNEE